MMMICCDMVWVAAQDKQKRRATKGGCKKLHDGRSYCVVITSHYPKSSPPPVSRCHWLPSSFCLSANTRANSTQGLFPNKSHPPHSYTSTTTRTDNHNGMPFRRAAGGVAGFAVKANLNNLSAFSLSWLLRFSPPTPSVGPQFKLLHHLN